jgi:hypothetical protein
MYEVENEIKYCTNCCHMEKCKEKVEKEHKTKTGRKGKRTETCGGDMLLSRDGYICEDCSHRISGYLMLDGVLVPAAYRGGEDG